MLFNPKLTKEDVSSIVDMHCSLIHCARHTCSSLSEFKTCMRMFIMSEITYLTVKVPPDEPHRPLRRSPRLAKKARVDTYLTVQVPPDEPHRPLRRSPRLAKKARVDYSEFF